mmetsp:Transcript_14115/g.27049  ORF Transcript_14115/g.27049 Transcript_14115/m.27049 type:complete len:250 (-) Transcript_14115:242-991(-)|eukprot:CAMPEP_0114239978 /NCGR_PEP_ID=MMETSP0058-20121206/8769_1 /TAXON_ID=36894 /ORGANISM="Pyramimonas parkeae, CCMP726" /LENGTH=249 /DNA_ID=CAMNT_0001352237 /DNA_START=32 /DNA_END=781 /DNA_ORIENTATION=-
MAKDAFDDASATDGFHLHGEQKLQFVTSMFDRIATSYDKVNWFISLGQTTLWRLLALSWMHHLLQPRAKVLDIGCGTGWVSWFMYRRYSKLQLRVEGLDCSQGMLQEARRRHPKLVFTHGDVCKLQYEDSAFDMVTTVYTLRNFPDLYQGLQEMVRVTKPGGCVVILDAFPTAGVMKFLLRVWLNYVMPPLAGLFIERKPYEYLAHSIQSTVVAPEVVKMLEQLGCETPIDLQKYSFGAAARIVAKKRS